MASTAATSSAGSADRWGPLWGARADDWARTEEQQEPTYEEAIRRVGIASGERVLEVGCGTGVFLRMAADRGAHVAGVDASEALIALAKTRVPEADLQVGDLQFLPYADNTFDLVAGFNAFFFAQDMTAALGEARRVAKPGAPVVIQVWGRPEACDLEAMKVVVRPLLPPPPPNAPKAPELWRPGVLEAIATEAGLAPETAFDASWAYEYEDERALVRDMLAVAGLSVLAGPEREPAVGREIAKALAPYCAPDGGYRLRNEWHFLVARA